MSREITVYADWDSLGGPQVVGLLRAVESRGSEVFAFSYGEGWLRGAPATTLDPDLGFYAGPQYLGSDERPNFGLFLDSSPDRWGRLLMRRREAVLARRVEREPRRLHESGYLLGVHDEQRLGALRFRLNPSGPFESSEPDMAVPPWSSIRNLEAASWHLQDEDGAGRDGDVSQWLSLLLAPGSSLGGARPKAGVKDNEGDLWIAKFPGRNDDRDVGAWEWVAWRLAGEAGARTPRARVMRTGRKHHTFLTSRFDRVPGSSGRRRLHFASAMTMLGPPDGAFHREGVSYSDLAEFLSNNGADPTEDSEGVRPLILDFG